MIEGGGLVFGIGIVAMHYCGMAAFQIPGFINWDATLVSWSIVLGGFFGAVATNRIGRPVTRFCKYGGSLAMGLAIVTTHFTAMAAMTVVPLAGTAISPQALSDTFMITGVVIAIAFIMVMASSAYIIDLHSAKEASDSYQRLALQDPLTGLPNRHHLEKRLSTILANNPDDTARIAVLAIDLDRFKNVNDVHGHGAGDAVLRAIASRVAGALGPTEFVARIGGDEFVAVKNGLFARGEAMKFAEQLQSLILEPVEWQGLKLSIGCSMGVALYPEHGTTGDLLSSRADLAMSRAKSLGRGEICTYEATMDEASRSRAATAMDLRQAIDEHQFELHYQVQNDTQSRAIVGFEALIRWNHPVKGRISPADFIPIAEETGLIVDIGDWVLRTACATAVGWTSPFKVAVNVAPVQLAHGDLPKRIAQILRETGLAANRLEIEITESGIIADQQHALQVVLALKAIGVTVAMDDFGTGYSSLSTLQNFPFDKIKVDRSFIQSVDHDMHSAAIVKSTLLLGKSLQIQVLAEGVETEQQLAFLSEANCDSVQGFLFGKPMSVNDVNLLIASESMRSSRSCLSLVDHKVEKPVIVFYVEPENVPPLQPEKTTSDIQYFSKSVGAV